MPRYCLVSTDSHAGSTRKSIRSNYTCEVNCDQLMITFKLRSFSEHSGALHVLTVLFIYTRSLNHHQSYQRLFAAICNLHTCAPQITLHSVNLTEISGVAPFSSCLRQNAWGESKTTLLADIAICACQGQTLAQVPAGCFSSPMGCSISKSYLWSGLLPAPQRCFTHLYHHLQTTSLQDVGLGARFKMFWREVTELNTSSTPRSNLQHLPCFFWSPSALLGRREVSAQPTGAMAVFKLLVDQERECPRRPPTSAELCSSC